MSKNFAAAKPMLRGKFIARNLILEKVSNQYSILPPRVTKKRSAN